MTIMRFFSKLFGGHQAVQRCYQAMIAQSRQPELFGDEGMGVPDTLDGRFESLALHIAIVHAAMESQPELYPIRQKLTEMLVSDLDNQFREIGISDSGIARKMTKMAEHLYGRIRAYRKGLTQGANAMIDAINENVGGENPKYLAEYALRAYTQMQSDEAKSFDLQWCRWPTVNPSNKSN